MLHLRTFPVVLLILLFVSESADARPEYAQQENRPCKACHVRSGFAGLNDEGRAFKAASTAGKSSAPATAAAPVQEKRRRTDAAATPAAGKVVQSGEAVTEKEAVTAHEDEEEDDEIIKAPPTVIYRWQGKDGSMVFSEHPSSPAESRKKETGGKQGRKSAKAKKVAAIKKRPAEKKTVQAAVPPAARKESFQECMERILVDEPEADSADEIMAILTSARETCSGVEK